MKNVCWASSLGGCDDQISGEHLVSKSFFPVGPVTVRGFKWCLTEPKTVGLGSLTSNILCRRHNSELSGLDEAVAATIHTMEDAIKLFNTRKALQHRYWKTKDFSIEGSLLERWLLKTFINLSVVDEKWIIGEGQHATGTPSEELVRAAFGLTRLRENLGLYFAAFPGETFDFKHGLKLTPKSVGPNLLAGMFTFYGFRFFLNLHSAPVTEHKESRLTYRPKAIWFTTRDDRGRNVRSHRMTFSW